METPYFSVRDLWEWAQKNGLCDAQIRVCDGMACSFFIDRTALARSPYCVVLDVSALPVFEYDELPASHRRVTYECL